MSNPLGDLMLATTTHPAGGELMSDQMLAMLAAGICALAAWTFVRLLRPGKFLLRRTPGRPNRLHVLHVLAVYLISIVAGSLAVLAVAAVAGIEIKPKTAAPMTVGLPAMAFRQLVLTAGTLAVAAATFRHGLGRGFGLSGRHWLSDTGRAVVGFLAILPLCITAQLLMNYLIEKKVLPIEPVKHPILEFLPTAAPAWAVVAFIVAGVLAPVAEELFFRGLVQSMLRRYLGGPWPAVLVTSALFAATHANLYRDMPAIMILGIALGYNYERTGRLFSPILIHALFNAAMLWQSLPQ